MKTRFFRAFFAGFLGTIVITCLLTFASPTLMGGPTDIASMLAAQLGGGWLAGMAMRFAVGTIVLPLLYIALVDRRLHGGPAVRGAVWGLGLWLVSQGVLIPASGGGFFSVAAGDLHVVTDSLAGHLAYGLVLGVLAGQPNERAFSVRQEFVPEPRLRRAA